MATSSTQIANTALARIGCGQLIASLEEDSQEARTMNLLYEQVRDQVLEDHPWPFAQAFEQLAQVAAPPDGQQYAYAYAMPADCLKPRRIAMPGQRRDTAESAVPFAEGDIAGDAVIYTDLPDPVVLEYTRQVTDETRFAPSFVDAFAWRLAYEAAMVITVAPGIRDGAWQHYRQAITKAVANRVGASQKDPDPDAPWITAHQGGGAAGSCPENRTPYPGGFTVL